MLLIEFEQKDICRSNDNMPVVVGLDVHKKCTEVAIVNEERTVSDAENRLLHDTMKCICLFVEKVQFMVFQPVSRRQAIEVIEEA